MLVVNDKQEATQQHERQTFEIDSEDSHSERDVEDEQPLIGNTSTAPPTAFQLFLIPFIHFVVGISNNIPSVANRWYMIDELEASPATQAMIGVLTGVTWNFKVVWAFVSDSFAIGGRRRKPYLAFGLIVQAVAWFGLGEITPEIKGSTGLMFAATMGQVLVGVMCDTLVVENMQHETGGEVGSLQSNCWIALSLGTLVGQLSGGLLLQYTSLHNRNIFTLNSGLKLLLLLCVVFVTDAATTRHNEQRIVDRATNLWSAMTEHRVFKPVIFIFVSSQTKSTDGAVSELTFV